MYYFAIGDIKPQIFVSKENSIISAEVCLCVIALQNRRVLVIRSDGCSLCPVIVEYSVSHNKRDKEMMN